ncbi:hypothetical protein FNYG_12816 [Fusarium nygamai]|uniref:Uncharacterized protein n=1 Tax=Gibberella nygamai TaxID=42673 RepID=A0A2K0VUZ4_GIBNY|nr:hypothetical protein FNYG_12816 [Fusarium nygamai]
MELLQMRELTRRPSGISHSDQYEYLEDGLETTGENSSRSPEDVPEALTHFFPSQKKKPTRQPISPNSTTVLELSRIGT